MIPALDFFASDGSVVPLDPVARARTLVRGWRACPVPELAARCRALAMVSRHHRLPSDVYDAWLCMQACVLAAGG